MRKSLGTLCAEEMVRRPNLKMFRVSLLIGGKTFATDPMSDRELLLFLNTHDENDLPGLHKVEGLDTLYGGWETL